MSDTLPWQRHLTARMMVVIRVFFVCVPWRYSSVIPFETTCDTMKGGTEAVSQDDDTHAIAAGVSSTDTLTRTPNDQRAATGWTVAQSERASPARLTSRG